MAKFLYIARDSNGRKVSALEEAPSPEELSARLQAQGLIVISIAAGAASAAASKPISGSKRKLHGGIKNEDLALFCRHLATLLGAGITILKSLDVITLQVSSRKLLIVLKEIEKNMQAGMSFHSAMAKYPKVFPELWVNIVESGEASGSLAVVLERLASYLERNESFKKKLISALVYPCILFIAGMGAILFMTLKIIPTFADLFKSFNMELPALTKVLVNFSWVLQHYFIFFVGGVVVAVWLFKKYISTLEGRKSFEQFLFKLPVVGDFFRILTIERFSSSMATLLESGVPILYSLEIAEHSVGNKTVGEIIKKIKEDVREGRNIGVSMEKYGFFEPMVIQMVSVGEEIGELPSMFKKLNAFYQEYVENFLVRIATMFEPIMLIFMAGVIGIMVVGMFLPIFQISQMGAQ